jgi:hypothetical protein
MRERTQGEQTATATSVEIVEASQEESEKKGRHGHPFKPWHRLDCLPPRSAVRSWSDKNGHSMATNRRPRENCSRGPGPKPGTSVPVRAGCVMGLGSTCSDVSTHYIDGYLGAVIFAAWATLPETPNAAAQTARSGGFSSASCILLVVLARNSDPNDIARLGLHPESL